MKIKQDFGVTALLALIAVLGAVSAADYLVFTGKGIETGMAFLGNIAIMGISYYVGKQAGQNQPPNNPPGGTDQ